MADEGMIAAQVIAQRNSGDLLDKIRCALPGLNQVANDGCDSAGVWVRQHDGYLGACPFEGPGSGGMTLSRIGVEQISGSPALDGCGELPSEVQGLSEASVNSLTAERRVDVGGVSGEKDAALARGCCLTGEVGVSSS